MYQVLKTIGVKIGVNKRWEEFDSTTMTLAQLYINYRKCYFKLQIIAGGSIVYFDLDSIKVTYATSTLTMADLFTNLGSTTLPTVANMPIINTKVARYRDAFQSGYKATPVHPLYGTNAAPDNRTALLLTRDAPAVDYSHFRNHCLISVNGFYHMTDTNGTDGVMVLDANKSLRISNQNQLGIYSFENIGNITCIPITPSMLYKNNNAEAYSSSTYIHTGVDLTDKTFMVVIGGYLHAPNDNMVSQVGINNIKIDFSNYHFADKYYESLHYIDLNSLNLSSTDKNLLQASMAELASDTIVEKYMSISQSFIVIIDTPEVFVNKQYLRKSNIYGSFISYVKPVGPLVCGLGRHPEYITMKETGQYALSVNDSTVQNRIYNTVNPVNLTSISDTTFPSNPSQPISAYLLEIGKDF